jgi:hypothetical protein
MRLGTSEKLWVLEAEEVMDEMDLGTEWRGDLSGPLWNE